MIRLTTGTRIYNHGDMANPSHFGTITKAWRDRGGSHYEIMPDTHHADSPTDRDKYTVSAGMISLTFEGHSGTRIVTEDAYNEWREERLAELRTGVS